MLELNKLIRLEVNLGNPVPKSNQSPSVPSHHRMGGSMPFHYPLREAIHTGVHNKVQVTLELLQVVGYLCYLNNQGLCILCNSVYL